MDVSYSKEAVAKARDEGLYLAKVIVNGRHAKKGSMAFAGPIGPEMARKLQDLIGELARVEDRMR